MPFSSSIFAASCTYSRNAIIVISLLILIHACAASRVPFLRWSAAQRAFSSDAIIEVSLAPVFFAFFLVLFIPPACTFDALLRACFTLRLPRHCWSATRYAKPRFAQALIRRFPFHVITLSCVPALTCSGSQSSLQRLSPDV